MKDHLKEGFVQINNIRKIAEIPFVRLDWKTVLYRTHASPQYVIKYSLYRFSTFLLFYFFVTSIPRFKPTYCIHLTHKYYSYHWY